MKSFLRKIGFFLLPIIVLAFALDFLITNAYKNSHNYPGEIEVWNDIYAKKVKSEIAIYGSSRAWVHFNSQMIEDSLRMSTYNFGMDGHNFWLQYLRHLELVKHNPFPKKIIVSLDIFSLQKRDDLNQPDQFLPFMLWNKNIKEFTSSYKGYKIGDYYLPLLRYAGKLAAIKSALMFYLGKENQTIYREKGFKGMDKAWTGEFEKAKSQMNAIKIAIDTPTVNLFQLFLKECKLKKTKVALVYAPEFKEGQDFVNGRKELIALFNAISKENEVPFFNYSNDSLCFDQSKFYNATHLNAIGANLFTQKCIQDLKQIQF